MAREPWPWNGSPRTATTSGSQRRGRLDAATLGGDAHVTLALEDLTPLVEPYGQRVAGAAELEANFAVGARAEVIGIDLYGKADALTGLPEGVGALVGAAPTLQANAMVVPDESIEVTHLRVKGSEVTLDGKLDLTLPGRPWMGH